MTNDVMKEKMGSMGTFLIFEDKKLIIMNHNTTTYHSLFWDFYYTLIKIKHFLQNPKQTTFKFKRSLLLFPQKIRQRSGLDCNRNTKYPVVGSVLKSPWTVL
jgi:hypothetical protein